MASMPMLLAQSRLSLFLTCRPTAMKRFSMQAYAQLFIHYCDLRT